ncbi:MAG: hypothetical protein KF900_11570 [Bacteroidetes bacterium]|nr:hypothetical protein [Bacteroidota bacterium]
MKKIVHIKNDVVRDLDELITTLFKEEYFGFLEDAEDYVNNLYDRIRDELPNITQNTAPEKLKRFGKYYAKLKSNRRTTWYVFFNQQENIIVVKFITNNHTPQGAYFNNL